MKIEKIKIENFKGITDIDKNLDGKSVYVIGGNAAGKTSFISSIFCALTGKNMPPNPIKGNAKTGKIQVELGQYLVELEFKKTGKKIKKTLSLFNKDGGEKMDSPRAKLDEIIGHLDFNPFDFMRMTPTPQLNYFCKVFDINIDDIENTIKEINESVTYDKKRLEVMKATISPFDEDLAEKDLIEVSQLTKEYHEAVDHNSKINEFEQRLKNTDNLLDQKREQLMKLEEEISTLSTQVSKGKAWLSAQSLKDVTGLRSQLDSVSETNHEILEAKKQKDIHIEYDMLEKNIETAKADKVKEVKAKQDLIAEHIKEIKGFDYDEVNGFTLDGLPFHVDQNNTAAQIVAGLKLGSGLLGDVKIARFDGSLLDNENLAIVNEFAEAQNLQLFVEIVDRENKDLKIQFVEDSI